MLSLLVTFLQLYTSLDIASYVYANSKESFEIADIVIAVTIRVMDSSNADPQKLDRIIVLFIFLLSTV